VYNYIKLTTEDINEVDSPAEGIDIITVPQAIQKLEIYIVAN
jgi:hypothetical protein